MPQGQTYGKQLLNSILDFVYALAEARPCRADLRLHRIEQRTPRVPPVINVHTHFQPSGIEQALEPPEPTSHAAARHEADRIDYLRSSLIVRSSKRIGSSKAGSVMWGDDVLSSCTVLGTPPVDSKTGKVVQACTAEV